MSPDTQIPGAILSHIFCVASSERCMLSCDKEARLFATWSLALLLVAFLLLGIV